MEDFDEDDEGSGYVPDIPDPNEGRSRTGQPRARMVSKKIVDPNEITTEDVLFMAKVAGFPVD